MQLSTSNSQDNVIIGIDPAASDDFDVGIDRPEPPAPPGEIWLQAYVQVEGQNAMLSRLDKSIDHPRERMTWNISFAAGRSVQEATLSWQGVEATGFAVELVVGEEIIDLRQAGSRTIRFDAGMLAAHVDAYVLDGTAPSPPPLLLARPGPRTGDISLTWLPPDQDGGLPLRGYHVFTREADGRTLIATVGLTTRYVDAHREVGEVLRYEVEAFNAIGASSPSPVAVGFGTGRERTLTPTSQPSDRSRLVGIDADTDSAVSTFPNIELRGAPSEVDGRTYTVGFNASGESHEGSIFAAGLLSDPFTICSDNLTSPLRIRGTASFAKADREVVIAIALAGVEEQFAAPTFMSEADFGSPDNSKR